ncbi:UNVERIFIED_CONTAM: hypothetical protein Sradi_0062700 [Sesamum radiatum]|uniref:Uncharacterized protein n=1 Tax=Sesamum radiatum TaxID=300843 RepID=A0AAW2WIB9_SESRA
MGTNDGRGPPPLDSPFHCESNETLPTNFHQVPDDIRKLKVFAVVGVVPPFLPPPRARSPSDNHLCWSLRGEQNHSVGFCQRSLTGDGALHLQPGRFSTTHLQLVRVNPNQLGQDDVVSKWTEY